MPATVRLLPAPVWCGVLFRRTDLRDGRNPNIEAVYSNVSDTTLNTRIENADGVQVSTIEHLMAAFAGCGVHNAIVEIDGPEVPVFDGSSHKFAQAILNAGVQEQSEPLNAIQIMRPVRVEKNGATAELVPDNGLFVDVTIEFDHSAIGRQSYILNMANGAFLRELSDCRTFCLQSDVEYMRERGLALGGDYSNAVVVDGPRILNPGGLRRDDEFVRHKMLDALGDLQLAGMPIWGRYIGFKSGHGLTNQLLRALFASPDAFRVVTVDAVGEKMLPGMDVARSDLAAVV